MSYLCDNYSAPEIIILCQCFWQVVSTHRRRRRPAFVLLLSTAICGTIATTWWSRALTQPVSLCGWTALWKMLLSTVIRSVFCKPLVSAVDYLCLVSRCDDMFPFWLMSCTFLWNNGHFDAITRSNFSLRYTHVTNFLCTVLPAMICIMTLSCKF